jgi:hypothetical protein
VRIFFKISKRFVGIRIPNLGIRLTTTLQFALAFRAETEQGAGGRGQQSKKGRTNLEQRRHAFNERGKGKGQEEKKILYFLSIHSTHYDQ